MFLQASIAASYEYGHDQPTTTNERQQFPARDSSHGWRDSETPEPLQMLVDLRAFESWEQRDKGDHVLIIRLLV